MLKAKTTAASWPRVTLRSALVRLSMPALFTPFVDQTQPANKHLFLPEIGQLCGSPAMSGRSAGFSPEKGSILLHQLMIAYQCILVLKGVAGIPVGSKVISPFESA